MRLSALSLLALAACASPPSPRGDAPALAALAEARAAHGSAGLDGATALFTFRGTPYQATHDGGRFRYARTRTEGGQTVEEIVDNDGARRLVDGTEVALSADEAAALHTSVNSVVYFALLPHALAAPAVRARSLAPDTVGGAPYRRVEVTFDQAGGGDDWQDRYVYWIHADRATVDYLAYSYEPTPGDTARAETGSRFREVIGVTEVPAPGGQTVRFQDYRNLTADRIGTEIERYGELFDAGQTFSVSEVRTEAPAVRAVE